MQVGLGVLSTRGWPLSPTPAGVNTIDLFVYAGGSGCPEHTWVAPVPDTYRGKYRQTDYPGQDLGELYAR